MGRRTARNQGLNSGPCRLNRNRQAAVPQERKCTINKSIIKEILKIGVPSFLETLFVTFANMIDSKMVSSMGVTAISAVSVTNPPRLFIFSVFIALNTVMTSLIARYLGQDDRDRANQIFDSILKITVGLSIILSVASVALARPIMIAFSHQPDTLDDSVTYFSIIMGGMIFNLVFMAINAGMRGCGKTQLTFTSNVLSSVVNIFFNYLLIQGHWGFPALGIKGAAIATVAGTVAACIYMIFIARDKDLFVNIPYCIKKKYKLTREGTEEIKKLATSTITDGLATRVSILIIGGIVARIGSFQMAVYSLGVQLLSVNQALGTGLQTAGVALIGRSYGSGDTKQMNIYKKNILMLGNIAAVVLGLIIIIGGRPYYSFFSSDPEFISLGAKSCLFIGAITLSQTMKFAYTGVLQGVGAMKEVMKSSIVSFGMVNLGTIAFCVFVLKIGIWGAWIGTLAAQTVQTIMCMIYTKKIDAFKEDAASVINERAGEEGSNDKEKEDAVK